jgi:hypothetical protein
MRALSVRLLVLAAAVGFGSAAAAVAACSSGHGAQAESTDAASTVDSPSSPDAGLGEEAPASSNMCGSPPYVTLGIVVVGLSLTDPNGTPLPGVELTSPLCPAVLQTSDEGGLIEGQVAEGKPFYAQLNASGYVPELTPEENFDASTTGIRVLMLPQLVQQILLPTFDAGASTAIFLAAQATVEAGACASFDGITFTVPNHPEAQVTYFSNDPIPVPLPDAGATTTGGLAVVMGLAGGQLVSVAATKPGCSVDLQYGALTGRVPLEPGYITLDPAYVTP